MAAESEQRAAPGAHPTAYVFLDEGGNLDFSPNGTKYFTLTGVVVFRPFPCDAELTELRFDLIESGLDIEYFHAAEDRQAIRDRVYSVIQKSLHRFRADTIVVEKSKWPGHMREDAVFYPTVMGHLLRNGVVGSELPKLTELILITDRVPVNRKRRVVEKSVKTTLVRMLPSDVRYRVLHHDSKSSCGLQIADYFNWAVYRAWDRGDRRSLDLIEYAIHNQLSISGEQ